MVIDLENIDKKIWNIETKIIEIISAGFKNDFVYIRLNNEGPCLYELKLIDILDNICETYSWPNKKFVIITSNLLKVDCPYQVIVNSVGLSEIEVGQQITITKSKQFDTICTFGIFIGRSNWNRLWLSSELHTKYKNKSLITFHFDPNSDYHMSHVGLDDLAIKGFDKLDQAARFLKQCPITLNEEVVYPIVPPSNFNILNRYSDIFVDVVCETYTSGHTFFPTEKTWRSIMSLTPFITYGPKNFLKNLQRVGFKTFSQWWDESYDQTDDGLRAAEIESLIHILGTKTNYELQTMYNEMLPTLLHNKKVFKTLTHLELNKIFDDKK